MVTVAEWAHGVKKSANKNTEQIQEWDSWAVKAAGMELV